jgi:tetratricopeptide (TPR) repeat protein
VLAKIEIDTKNYNEALRYLDQTNKYPYRHFCGNEYAADAIYMATMYSNCYLALNDYEKAFDVLLPNILENGLADNSYLIKNAYEALLKKHRKEDLKIEFENAFKNIITEKEISGKYEYTNYYIRFQNRKIQLEPWSLNVISSEEELKKVAIGILTNSEFYKLLMQ